VTTRQHKVHTQLGRAAVQIFAANDRLNQIALDIPFYRTRALGTTYRPIVLNWQSPRESNFRVARRNP
jgi:hypothetical protein